MDISNRIGRFKISSEIIRKGKYEDVLKLFSNFIVLRCEHNYTQDTFDYVAYSPLFKEVPEGSIGPEYLITVHKEMLDDENYNLTFEAKEIDTDDLTIDLGDLF